MSEVEGPQQATALGEALTRIKNENQTSPKPLWIVKVEDNTTKLKQKTIVCLSYDWENQTFLSVVGFETSNENADKLNTYRQAIEYVESSGAKIFQKKIPWLRVIELEHKTYDNKNLLKKK